MARLIDANALESKLQGHKDYFVDGWGGFDKMSFATKCRVDEIDNCIAEIVNAPTVDAVELPKGKPGDYLEWDNGTGFRQIYHIHAVMICEDCIRYDLEKFAPVVNHPGIVRFLTLEEAEREWKEMCEKLKTEEEPTLTAVSRERRTDERKAD